MSYKCSQIMDSHERSCAGYFTFVLLSAHSGELRKHAIHCIIYCFVSMICVPCFCRNAVFSHRSLYVLLEKHDKCVIVTVFLSRMPTALWSRSFLICIVSYAIVPASPSSLLKCLAQTFGQIID